MYNIHSAALPVWMLLAVWSQSPSEEVPLYVLGRVLWAMLTGGQSVALWEEGVRNSLCLFTATLCDGPLSSVLGGVSNRLFKAWKQAWLAVCGSLLSLWEDSSELLPVTPLAFSDLALDHLGGNFALPLGGSGVDVLICWFTSAFWLASWTCCCSRCLVTALCCWSLTAWTASWNDLVTMAISGRDECRLLSWWLPASGDDGLDVSLLLDSLPASYSALELYISLWEDVLVSNWELQTVNRKGLIWWHFPCFATMTLWEAVWLYYWAALNLEPTALHRT